MRFSLATSAIALTIAVASCAAPKETLAETTPVTAATVAEDTVVADATAFMARAESQLSDMSDEASIIFWNQATNITDETNAAAAEVGARYTKLAVSLANESKQFNLADLPPELARKMTRLRRHHDPCPVHGRRSRRTGQDHNRPRRDIRNRHLQLQGQGPDTGRTVDNHRNLARSGRAQSRLGRLAHRLSSHERRLCPHGGDRQ